MKLLHYIFAALSAIVLVSSCSDNDDGTTGKGNAETITLSSDILQVTKDGGTETITVTSSGDWKLSGLADWVHPSATSGKNGDVVTFTIDPNIDKDIKTTTFKFFTGAAVAPLTIESAPDYQLELLSDAEISVSKDEKSFLVQLNTNIANLDIESNVDWLTFDKRTDFAGKTNLTFAITGNAYKNRLAEVSIGSKLSSNPVIIKVTQKQVDAVIPEQSSFVYDLTAREFSFKVRYNVDYSVSVGNNNWISYEGATDGETGDDGLTTAILTFKLAEATANRGGSITINGAGSTTVTVVQKDPNTNVIDFPDPQLFAWLLRNNWILSTGTNQGIVTELGLKQTQFRQTSYSIELSDLTGLENFPNLTSVNLGYCRTMPKMDISGLHKVNYLKISYPTKCEEFNLGDNPLTTFEAGGSYSHFEVQTVKVISSEVESINLNLYSSYADDDYVTTIDVSECPKLTTLKAVRSEKLKTIILKKGQEIPNLTKQDFTKITYK